MQATIQTIMEQFSNIIEFITPLAITLGLAQWLIRFILSAILGDYRGRFD